MGADHYVVALGYVGANTYPFTGATVLASTDSNGGDPFTVLLAVPAGSTGTVTATSSASSGAVYSGAFASVNGYTS